ncbi:D-alanyl-D-alanine carboxypeptidase/D-alanyl-D-alanine-endopeptidase [Skermania piniformis]|uniref:D-alanyl-D-alanine carboxypeptidase/D-alanyl-D-alanine-endopeptidase n=1 Tax=Skermania pinensis TaxID=39122 RepID=A0ABX8SDQ0_9ACTN|nr:D-alanyl-D-alanine carboxypeptidase/D-alanyl-D-alanine-endopeptidase [Skermania piniformis]
MGYLARRRRNIRALLVSIVLLLLGVTGALILVHVVPLRADAARGGLVVAPEPPPVTPQPQLAALPAAAPTPDPTALANLLREPSSNPDLGSFSGIVSDAATGQVLWSTGPERPMTPASTVKVLTAAAALSALPADHRVATDVVRGTAPNELVLVGRGDPTVTAQPLGKPNIYPGSAHLDDLVEQIKRSGVQPDTILVDTSAYTGPALAQGWQPGDVGGGYIAPIEPVMIDGARLDPLAAEPPRSPTPALDAGRMLATALGVDPANVRLGRAPAGAAPVAGVRSAPLRDRLAQMMGASDNVLAEAVGREIAIGRGAEPSFAGTVTAIGDTLREAGFDLAGLTLHDASGLSVDDRAPAQLLNQVLAQASGPEKPMLRPMLDYLPVAGATGTLADRYAAANRAGAGWVRAKTGTLSDASALAGYVVDDDERVLTFALMSNGRSLELSRPALDALASTLRTCGCR